MNFKKLKTILVLVALCSMLFASPMSILAATTNQGFDNDYLFEGKELDEELGIYYFDNRYYDPDLGRFLSPDPAVMALGDPEELMKITGMSQQEFLSDPQRLNAYSFARNNPLIYVDPTGEDFYHFENGNVEEKGSGTTHYYEQNDVEMLEDNAKYMESNKLRPDLFYNKVNTGSAWDYKNLQDGRGYYFFNGKLVTGEEFGNYNYGYTGTAGGFGKQILLDAPGFVQEKPQLKNWVQTNFDDLRDSVNIKEGVDYYNQKKSTNSSTALQRIEDLVYYGYGGPIISRGVGLYNYVFNHLRNKK